MSKDNVMIRLTNKETLNKFQHLKAELSKRYTKRYTNDDVIHYLLQSVSLESESDTLLDTLPSQSDTLSVKSDTPQIHFDDFVTKDELSEQLEPINIVGERMYKMIQDLQNRVIELEKQI